jgi:hypothetical protein
MTGLPRLRAMANTVAMAVTTTHSQPRCPARFQPVSSALATAASWTARSSCATGSASAAPVAWQRWSTLPTASEAPSSSQQRSATSRRLSR